MTATRLNPQERTETVGGWTARHLADGSGRVELRKDVDSGTLSYSQGGSPYEAKVCEAQAYPFTFAAPPMKRVDFRKASGGAITGFEWTARDADNPKTHFPTLFALRPNAATNSTVSVTLVAVGVPA